jgi:hypothetical protein
MCARKFPCSGMELGKCWQGPGHPLCSLQSTHTLATMLDVDYIPKIVLAPLNTIALVKIVLAPLKLPRI